MPRPLPVTLLLFSFAAVGAEVPPVQAGVRSPDLERTADAIVQRTNAFRCPLEPVQPDPVLRETALYFADYLARTDRFGHGADGSGPAERAERHGYEICLISENLAYQFDSRGFSADELASKTVEGWKESPGHRENLVDPHVTETGVAVAGSDRSGHYYAVQLFGRPRSDSIEFRISNESRTEVSYRLDGETFPLPPRYRRTHEQCRPAELRLQLPGERDAETIEPQDGDAFTVVADDSGRLSLRGAR